MKIPLVKDEALKKGIEEAKNELQRLMNKRRKTIKDKLVIEYLRTFIDNPTPVNCLLLECGRADEMKRKEETERQVESYNYKIPSWALSYLFNRDSLGLEEKDLQAIRDFELIILAKHGVGVWSVEGEESYFSHYNNVTDLAGDVYDCLYNIVI